MFVYFKWCVFFFSLQIMVFRVQIAISRPYWQTQVPQETILYYRFVNLNFLFQFSYVFSYVREKSIFCRLTFNCNIFRNSCFSKNICRLTRKKSEEISLMPQNIRQNMNIFILHYSMIFVVSVKTKTYF